MSERRLLILMVRSSFRGRLQYGADGIPEDALLVKIIRSPYHHADFTFGDLDGLMAKNKEIAGIFHAAHIEGINCFGVIPPQADQPVFAEKTTRFKGEAVAMIVGTSDGIKNFKPEDFPISWQEKTALLTPKQAMAKDAPRLHAERADNC